MINFNKLRIQNEAKDNGILRREHIGRQIAATCRSNTSQQQISSREQENFIENFVAATEFCRCNMSHKIKLV